MLSSFNSALSALSADSTAISVVGNNLANLNTTGFKASSVAFHDLISQQIGPGAANGQVGMGVGQVSATQNFNQGSITSTGGPLDAAVSGDGFFVVKDSNNNQLYTRAGNFQLDSTGTLRTSTGDTVQGWTATNGVIDTNGSVGNISLPVSSVIAPKVTTDLNMNINLNAAAPTTGTGSTFSAPMQIYDAQGTAHTVTFTFTKTAANKWDYKANIAAGDLSDPNAAELATGSLEFDGSGKLTTPPPGSPATLKVTKLADGASDFDVQWDFYDKSDNPLVSQFAQTSGMAKPVQDGNAAGTISKIAIQDNGVVVANYTNGQQVTMGQLALASIANPTSLVQVGNNNLQASAATAQAAIGAAGTGGRGQISGGALESSTTDMAQQFTQLLTFERSYQAASRVITTTDTLMQETVNLIHG